MDKKTGSLLGLCMKAGKLATGEFACERALARGDARLVIIAADASDNTKKKFTNKGFYYKTPVVISGTRDEISKVLGRENRVVAVVMDEHFADGLQKSMEVGGCLN